MPILKGAKKRVATSQKKKVNNNDVLKSLSTSYKKAQKAIQTNDANKDEYIKDTFSKADKAKSKGLIHQNKANRIKSNLTKKAS